MGRHGRARGRPGQDQGHQERVGRRSPSDDDKVDATGEFESSIKGVEKGKVGFKYDPAEGLAITGEITLGKLSRAQGRQAGGRRQGGQGRAGASRAVSRIQPDVPGVDGDVTGTYDDGAFLVEANLVLQQGHGQGVGPGRADQPGGRPDGQARPGPRRTRCWSTAAARSPWPSRPGCRARSGSSSSGTAPSRSRARSPCPTTSTSSPRRRSTSASSPSASTSRSWAWPCSGSASASSPRSAAAWTSWPGSGRASCGTWRLEVDLQPRAEDDTRVTGSATFAMPAHAGLKLFVDGGLGVGHPGGERHRRRRDLRRAGAGRGAAGLGQGGVDARPAGWCSTPRASSWWSPSSSSASTPSWT